MIRAFAACPAELAHVCETDAKFGGVMVACWVPLWELGVDPIPCCVDIRGKYACHEGSDACAQIIGKGKGMCLDGEGGIQETL